MRLGRTAIGSTSAVRQLASVVFDDRLLFDVQGEKCIGYSSIKDCEQKLTAELRALLS